MALKYSCLCLSHLETEAETDRSVAGQSGVGVFEWVILNSDCVALQRQGWMAWFSSPFFSLCDFPTFSPPLPLKKKKNFLSFLLHPKSLHCLRFYIYLPSFSPPLWLSSLQSSLPFFFYSCLHLSPLSHTVPFIPSFFFPTFLNFWGAATMGCTPTVSMVMGGPRVLCAIQTSTGDSVFLHMTHNISLFLLPTFLLDLWFIVNLIFVPN